MPCDCDSRHLADAIAVIGDLSEGEDRVHECGDEEAYRELARLVLQDALDDAGRELAHRELHDDHSYGEYECGEAHHRGSNCLQDDTRSIRSADEVAWDCLIGELTVNCDRPEREQHPDDNTQHGHEPQSRRDLEA